MICHFVIFAPKIPSRDDHGLDRMSVESSKSTSSDYNPMKNIGVQQENLCNKRNHDPAWINTLLKAKSGLMLNSMERDSGKDQLESTGTSRLNLLLGSMK